MKKITTIIGVLLSTIVVGWAAASTFTADITLTWSNNPPSEFVDKYLVYQAKLPSTNFVAVVTANATNVAKVRVTSPGTYQYKVSAVNGMGESAKSAMVQVPNVSPSTPTNVAVLGISITVTNN